MHSEGAGTVECCECILESLGVHAVRSLVLCSRFYQLNTVIVCRFIGRITGIIPKMDF